MRGTSGPLSASSRARMVGSSFATGGRSCMVRHVLVGDSHYSMHGCMQPSFTVPGKGLSEFQDICQCKLDSYTEKSYNYMVSRTLIVVLPCELNIYQHMQQGATADANALPRPAQRGALKWLSGPAPRAGTATAPPTP